MGEDGSLKSGSWWEVVLKVGMVVSGVSQQSKVSVDSLRTIPDISWNAGSWGSDLYPDWWTGEVLEVMELELCIIHGEF